MLAGKERQEDRSFLCLLNKNGYGSLETSAPSFACIDKGRVLGNPYP